MGTRNLPSRARLEIECEPIEGADPEYRVGLPTGLANDWMHSAACLSQQPEMFFPVGPRAFSRIDEAKGVCLSCPVIAECLRVALADPTLLGIWGGTSEVDRDDMRRMRFHAVGQIDEGVGTRGLAVRAEGSAR